MPRIAKADVYAVLQRTAKTIVEAGGADGRTSRAEMKKALSGLTGKEKALADVFFKFIDHRDFKSGAQVTKADVQRAVGYAKEKMVAKYDLDNNGLSGSEVKKMSLTGRLAVDVAKALKAAAGGDVTAASFAKDLAVMTKNIRFDYYGSEADDAWKPFTANLNGALTKASFSAALNLPGGPEGEVTERSAKEFFAEMADTSDDAPLGSDQERADYKKLGEAMFKHLKDVKVFLVGADEVVQGKVYLCGRAPDGKLVGVSATRIWT